MPWATATWRRLVVSLLIPRALDGSSVASVNGQRAPVTWMPRHGPCSARSENVEF
jgi:hypothetical protein